MIHHCRLLVCGIIVVDLSSFVLGYQNISISASTLATPSPPGNSVHTTSSNLSLTKSGISTVDALQSFSKDTLSTRWNSTTPTPEVITTLSPTVSTQTTPPTIPISSLPFTSTKLLPVPQTSSRAGDLIDSFSSSTTHSSSTISLSNIKPSSSIPKPTCFASSGNGSCTTNNPETICASENNGTCVTVPPSPTCTGKLNDGICETKPSSSTATCSGYTNRIGLCEPFNITKTGLPEETSSTNTCDGYINKIGQCMPTNFPNKTTNTSPETISASTCDGYINKVGQCMPTSFPNKTNPPTESAPTQTSYWVPATTTDCLELVDENPEIVWSFLPNTTTITITVTANMSTTLPPNPGYSLPTFCPPFNSTIDLGDPFLTSSPVESGSTTLVTTTYITTSKVAPTEITIYTPPVYGGGGATASKVSVTPPPDYTPAPQMPSNPEATNDVMIATTLEGIPVIFASSQVVIGDQTFFNGDPATQIIAGGETFSINPSQIIAASTTISRPGGVFIPIPAPTVVNGISVEMNPGNAVIAGTTYSIGEGASQQTVVVEGQTISIGSAGLRFASTTLAPLPTNVAILDGQLILADGSSVAIIGSDTFTYGADISPRTEAVDGQMITIGPSGVEFGISTIGGPSNPTGVQIGIAGGVSITEIGSRIAVISMTTLWIGPGVPNSTLIIDGRSITAGAQGLVVGGATLEYPFNPVTQTITANGIPIAKIGSSLVNVGSTVYTIGAGAKEITKVIDGQTISIGPDGVGLKSSTVLITKTQTQPSETASAIQTIELNGVGRVEPLLGVLGIGIAVGAGFNVW